MVSRNAYQNLPSFRYRDLTSPNEIRLLEISTNKTGKVKLDLKHHLLLGSCPSFVAVSYRWGDLSSNPIALGGRALCAQITIVHLITQLAKMPSPSYQQTGPRYFWIDSLCINQSSRLNDRELQHQIPLMKQIYSRADHVIAWLGNSSLVEAGIIENAAEDNISRSYAWSELSKQTKRGIEIICGKAIWRRIWVIQEIVLAKGIVIMWGPTSMQWNELCRAMWSYKIYADRNGKKFYNSVFHYLWKIETARREAWMRQSLGYPLSLKLEDLLIFFMGEWEATRAHDRVYGLLGLAEEKIDVDYNQSLAKLFRAVRPYLKDPAAIDLVWNELCR